MTKAQINTNGSPAADAFLRERFALTWGPDVYGITADGVRAEQTAGEEGLLLITIGAKCTRADVETLIGLMWGPQTTKETP